MSELKALLWDVDGTLADTERDGHRVAFNQAFAAAGLDWQWTTALYGELLAVSGGKERIRHFMATHTPNVPESLPVMPVDAFVAGLHERKTRHYLALLEQGAIPLRIGVESLLTAARNAGLRLAIVTTTTPENVSQLLAHTLGAESLDWFEVIAAGDVVPAKKPAADIYHYACEALRLPVSECLAIEDSRNGLLSALGAGIRTLITVTDYTRGEDFSGAALVVDQLGTAEQPFSVIQGNAHQATHVDLHLLRALHQQS